MGYNSAIHICGKATNIDYYYHPNANRILEPVENGLKCLEEDFKTVRTYEMLHRVEAQQYLDEIIFYFNIKDAKFNMNIILDLTVGLVMLAVLLVVFLQMLYYIS